MKQRNEAKNAIVQPISRKGNEPGNPNKVFRPFRYSVYEYYRKFPEIMNRKRR